MSVTTSLSTRASVKADAVVLFFYQDQKDFDAAVKNLIKDVPHAKPVIDSKDFEGKALQTALVYCGSGYATNRIILVGLGKKADVSIEIVRRAAAVATKAAAACKSSSVAYDLPEVKGLDAEEIAQAVSEGACLSQYKYDKHKTVSKNKNGQLVKKFTILSDKTSAKLVKKGADSANAIIAGVMAARDLANAPNNEIYPETLGKAAVALGKMHGFKTTVLDKKKIQALKMGGLLGVNQGSVRPPVFIIMEYYGGPKSEKPIVLVGKGITFDTGGISIKPAAGMSDMKGDMHGSATVIGTMATIAASGIKRNVIGLVPSTENMPSGTAMVPGDILTFMNGKTAEIDNTDAEGRLVLADALCYAERYKPQAVIDLATLTGAVVVALGNVTTGMMGNDDGIKAKLKKAAARTSEYVCELPLYEEYEELISSDYADIKNSGGRGAGSITAGLFLQHFVSYPWVHLDIAGTGMTSKATHYTPRGCTGVGVRLLTEAIKNW
ncbi:MAG: leucyl aminopeptidase [Ignavibacteria bacterium]|nr:leucyl aminopeptidase [Ignavibacteria bacterium]